MPKYTVKFMQSVQVEAKDEEEAMDKAIDMAADEPEILMSENMMVEVEEM